MNSQDLLAITNSVYFRVYLHLQPPFKFKTERKRW